MENKVIFYSKKQFTFAYKLNTVIDDHRSFLLHSHPYPEIYAYIGKASNFVIEGATFRLNPYDVVVIPPYKLHCPTPQINTAFERCLIHISPSFYENTAYSAFENLFKESNVFNYKFPGYAIQRTDIPKILKFLIDTCQHDNQYTYPVIRCKIIELLHILSTINKYESFHSLDDISQNIIDYIERTPLENLTIQDIFDHFHYSPSYLNRIFKNSTGITINKYINLKRLQYVIELHKKGHSLIYACMEAKFPNYEAFTYLYKKEFGCSPSKDFPN